jgi:DNA-directed RNA polymerase specialized sigma24 family protein
MANQLIDLVLPIAEETEAWVARRFRLQRADAEDIVRDVLVSFIRCNPEGVKNPRAYFYAACARRARKTLHEKRRTKCVNPFDLAEQCEAPEPPCGRLSTRVVDLGRLTVAQREMALLMAEGYKPVEMAQKLGIAPSTARWRLHQLRKSLRGSAA